MKNKVILLMLISILFFSCDNRSYSEGKFGKQKISRTVQSDNGEFIDVTLDDINASIVTNSDFNIICDGTYFHEDGSFITISSSSELCYIHSESCKTLDDNNGKSFDACFSYKVNSASPNVLYLRPVTKDNVSININGRPVPYLTISSFAPYIPLYGFGQNRLEVNPILNGEIALPSGTYWKK